MSDLQTAMDERLEAALSSSNYRLALHQGIQIAKLKLEQALTYSINGGTFKIDMALISFCAALIANNHTDAILLDVNDNPIEIPDLQQFNTTIIDSYYRATNTYLIERNRLKKSRTTSAVVLG